MTLEIKIAIFIIVSAGLVCLSRHSLKSFRSHGLYRLFVWLAVLALILENLEYWFENLFAYYQIVSWFLLSVSATFATCGLVFLRRGKPDNSRDDPTLIGLEKTTVLVTSGLYRFIRHPMYSAFLFMAWGIFFKHVSWFGVLLAGIATIFVFITARKEEAENISYFGETYREYMKESKMFIPFFF